VCSVGVVKDMFIIVCHLSENAALSDTSVLPQQETD
jgi:hypothetical protein